MAYAYDETNKVYEKGYLYAFTGTFDKNQIYNIINDTLKPILGRNIRIEINVVKNKENVSIGHSYLWTPEIDVYELLCGKNKDGTERVEYIDNPNWLEKEDVDLTKVIDWGELAYDEPEKIMKEQEPLFVFPTINEYTLEVQPAFYIENHQFQNAIVCTKVPRWVSNEMLIKRFKFYEKDTTEHFVKKEKRKFTYPILERRRDFCKITFSPLYSKTAYFAINMTKKVLFKNNDKEALLFFSLAYKR